MNVNIMTVTNNKSSIAKPMIESAYAVITHNYIMILRFNN